MGALRRRNGGGRPSGARRGAPCKRAQRKHACWLETALVPRLLPHHWGCCAPRGAFKGIERGDSRREGLSMGEGGGNRGKSAPAAPYGRVRGSALHGRVPRARGVQRITGRVGAHDEPLGRPSCCVSLPAETDGARSRPKFSVWGWWACSDGRPARSLLPRPVALVSGVAPPA